MADVIHTLDRPALFWLDAHDSGGATASAGCDPIAKEIEAIHADPGPALRRPDRRCQRSRGRRYSCRRPGGSHGLEPQRYDQDHAGEVLAAIGSEGSVPILRSLKALTYPARHGIACAVFPGARRFGPDARASFSGAGEDTVALVFLARHWR
jgi:hypothetical protein